MKTRQGKRTVQTLAMSIVLSGALSSFSAPVDGSGGIDLSGTGFIENLPDLYVADYGMSYTNFAGYVVNLGQLIGVNSDGSPITNSTHLLPFVGESLQVLSSNGTSSVLIDGQGIMTRTIEVYDESAGAFVPLVVSNGSFQVNGTAVGSSLSWSDITDIPSNFSDNVDNVLDEATVDSYTTNNGFFMADGSLSMTGPLDMGGNSLTNLGVMTANLDMNGSSLTNLGAMTANLDMGGNGITNISTIWLVDEDSGDSVALTSSNKVLMLDGLVAADTNTIISMIDEAGFARTPTNGGLSGSWVLADGRTILSENGMLVGFGSGTPTWAALPSTAIATNTIDLAALLTAAPDSSSSFDYEISAGTSYATLAVAALSFGWTPGDDNDKSVTVRARHAAVDGFVAGSWADKTFLVSKASQGTAHIDAPASALFCNTTNPIVVSGTTGPNPIKYYVTSDPDHITTLASGTSNLVLSGWTAGDDADKYVTIMGVKESTTQYLRTQDTLDITVSKYTQDDIVFSLTSPVTHYVVDNHAASFPLSMSVSAGNVNAYSLSAANGTLSTASTTANVSFDYTPIDTALMANNYTETITAASSNTIYKTQTQTLTVNVKYTGYLLAENSDVLTTESGDPLFYLY